MSSRDGTFLCDDGWRLESTMGGDDGQRPATMEDRQATMGLTGLSMCYDFEGRRSTTDVEQGKMTMDSRETTDHGWRLTFC